MGERWAVLLSFLKTAHLERHLDLHVNKKYPPWTLKKDIFTSGPAISPLFKEAFLRKHFQLCNTFLTKQFASTTSPICLACHGEEEKCIIMQYDTTSFALLGVNGAFRQTSEAQVQTISGCVYLRSTIIPPTMQCLRCLKANRKWHLQIGTSYLFNFTCTLMILLLSYWNAIRYLWQFHLWLC